MKNDVPNINWSVLLSDVGFLAAERAANDPECRKEIEPIRAEKQRLINELRDEENKIYKKYKQKYLNQLCAEKEINEKLIVEYLEKRRKEREAKEDPTCKEILMEMRDKINGIFPGP